MARNLTQAEREALSVARIRLALQTLSAAAGCADDVKFTGAIDAGSTMAFLEAKRNLTALVEALHGNGEWFKIIDHETVDDEGDASFFRKLFDGVSMDHVRHFMDRAQLSEVRRRLGLRDVDEEI